MSKSSGKRVLITGASSGIGAAVAHAFAARGAHVWVAARRRDRLDALVKAIEGAGGTAHAVTLDVQNLDELESTMAALDEEAGGFDVVIANAGIGGRGQTATGITLADARRVFDVNLTGAIGTLLGAQTAMIKRGRGHLVAVSSLAGELPLPVALDYGTTKAGLSYFVRGMRHDLRAHGVDTTLVLPGFVRSEITDKNNFPMPFIISAEKAAKLIVDGIEKRRAEVRFPFAYRLAFLLAAVIPSSWVGALAIKTAPPPSGGK